MAAVEAEGVFQVVEAFSRRLVAAVDEPAVGLQENGRAQVTVAVPPIAWAAGRTAGAEDAFVEAVELGAVFRGLQAFAARRRRGVGLEPGFDRRILRIEIVHVGHEVFDHRHMRQGIDAHLAPNLVDRLGAGQRVGAVDIHRAGAADALAAGAAEGEARV